MHLYVHVPFCARRCSYCDFAIAVRREVPSHAFTAAVLREWHAWQPHPAWADSPGLETVYFGGGTPSRLGAASLALLLQRFLSDRAPAPDVEITLEANPDDVTERAAAAWTAAGVNRVSLGAQSFSPAALAWMHRTHQAEQVEQAMHRLRGAGLRNISLDLIYALPSAIPRDWSADLEQALELAPTHLSFYGLTVEPGTPLQRWTARGQSVPAADERAAQEFLAGHQRLQRAGFVHYEVSNAARPGWQARHNSAYWQRKSFIGLGPSAHSAFGSTRSWNVREWEEYRRRSEAGTPVRAESEILSSEQVRLERHYLGLRTRDGLSVAELAPATRASWARQGWAEEDAGRVRLTPEGWLRLDALVASLTHC